MAKYAAFLRAINVGGYSVIKMEALRGIFASLGFKNIATYIQSGNIIFEAKEDNPIKLNKKIEKHLAKELGYEITNLLRTSDEIKNIVINNPFDETKLSKELQLYLVFLPDVPTEEIRKTLASLTNEAVTYKIINREIYTLIRVNKIKNPFSNNLVEKKIKMKTTSRNWNTVRKIDSMLNL